MQSRERTTATSDERPTRRRGARARSRLFVLGRAQRRSDDWDVRALSLPAPLLTAPLARPDQAVPPPAPEPPAPEPPPATPSAATPTAATPPAATPPAATPTAPQPTSPQPSAAGTSPGSAPETEANPGAIPADRAPAYAVPDANLADAEAADPGPMVGDDELEDTAEWLERPSRAIDISDGPKLIHRPDPPRPPRGGPDAAPRTDGNTAQGAVRSQNPPGAVGAPGAKVPGADAGVRGSDAGVRGTGGDAARGAGGRGVGVGMPGWRTAETPFPPHQRRASTARSTAKSTDRSRDRFTDGSTAGFTARSADRSLTGTAFTPNDFAAARAVRVTGDPASVQLVPVPVEVRPETGPTAARARRGGLGGRTLLPDPADRLTDAPRTAEALLTAVLCLAALAVARVAGATAASLVPLSAIPAVGLLALLRPGGPAARTARAAALLTAGAALAALDPGLAPATLLVAAGVAVTYPQVAGVLAGRIVTALAVLSLVAPLAVPQPQNPLLLAGTAVVALLGAHALRVQRALVRAVSVALARERSARHAADRLEHARAHDAATGLATRETLLQKITNALTTSRPVGVLVIDLERFDTIVDHHGAAVAELVAEAVAARLNPENAARLGRSRFALLFRDASPDRCAEAARDVAALLEQPLTDDEIVVTAAIGAALSSPLLGTATDLLQGAEEATRAARAAGTARWCLFRPEMRANAQARAALEEELRQAIRHHTIETVFEPLLALGTGRPGDNQADDRIVGAEALPRWVRTDDTEVERAHIFPLAEQLGLGCELGLQLLDASLDALVTWRQEGIGVDQVWLNVPTTALADPGFAHELTARLAVRGLASSSIVVQISNPPMEDDERLSQALGLVRSLGIAVALDGVGAGGASLAALRRLPVSAVKLDRALTTELDRNDAVPRGIAQLSRSLGLRVVLTGVETHEQLDGARRIAADAAQGHAIARPLSAEDVTNLLSLRLPREFRLA